MVRSPLWPLTFEVNLTSTGGSSITLTRLGHFKLILGFFFPLHTDLLLFVTSDTL